MLWQALSENQLVDFKVEENIASIIKDLNAQGLSLRKIAKMLNAMAVPTKCRGKAWHPEMVRRILGARDGTDS